MPLGKSATSAILLLKEIAQGHHFRCLIKNQGKAEKAISLAGRLCGGITWKSPNPFVSTPIALAPCQRGLQDLDTVLAVAWPVKFAEIHSLPCPKNWKAVVHNQGHA